MKKMLYITLVFIQLVLIINTLFGLEINNKEFKSKIDSYLNNSEKMGIEEIKDSTINEYW